jgi:hypothetical protein
MEAPGKPGDDKVTWFNEGSCYEGEGGCEEPDEEG